MNGMVKKALLSLLVFFLVFYGSRFFFYNIDIYQNTLFYLAGVIGAGCFWIGINRNT